MNDELTAYCSKCLSKTVHQPIVEKTGLFRKRHQCTKCRAFSVRCCVRRCGHMAVFPSKKGSDKPRPTAKLWCAEHGGEISSFKKLSLQLLDLVEWNQFFKRDSKDMRKVTKRVVVAASLATAAIPVAQLVAPALAARLGAMGLLGAASTGTRIATLSGAALKSASLASIGGGAVAAGGGGMAVGTGILVASGAIISAEGGGLVAQAYFGEVKDYKIIKLSEGEKGSMVFVNGFGQQRDDKFEDWLHGTSKHFPNSSAYGVTWESGSLYRLANYLSGKKMTRTAVELLANEFGSKTSKVLGNIRFVKLPAKVLESTLANPWHKALYKSGAVGAMNAEMLARYDGPAVSMMGHSLGARTIFIALLNLAEKSETQCVQDVFLFGGAVARNNPDEWEKAASVVSGTIWNFYSDNDQILAKLYRVANSWFGKPIGSAPIECAAPNIRNIDCTDIVTGHMLYKPNLPALLSRVL